MPSSPRAASQQAQTNVDNGPVQQPAQNKDRSSLPEETSSNETAVGPQKPAEEVEGDEEESEAYKKLHHIQKIILTRHANDVKNSVAIRQSLGYHLSSRPFFSVIASLMQVISHTIVVLISNPMAPLTDPTNYFYALFVYGFIYFNLFIFTCCLVTARVFHFDDLIRRISREYAGGLGITAWADHQMFESQRATFDAARKVLGSKLDESDTPLDTPIHLQFDREVAMAILLMSSILYERDTKEVKNAFNYPEQAKEYLLKSEERLYKCGEEWGCKFVSIANFQTAQGPFAGAFYDIETGPVPFIVLVFKGTSPQALNEWIVDISFNLEASADRLGEGFAHQGFYSSLFPSSGPADKLQPSPHLRILETIEIIAKEAFEKTGKRTNLFVGGHSLGAGVASLFYARLLESPSDLGCHTILRDAYCFGTPRACGASLASRFDYNLAKPVNYHRALWTICNKSRFSPTGDIVTRVPPGLADARTARSALREGSLLSYAAIGISVILLPQGDSPFFKFGRVPAGYKVTAHRATKPGIKKPKALQGPIKVIDFLCHNLFPIFHDHFPGCYFSSLNNMSIDQMASSP